MAFFDHQSLQNPRFVFGIVMVTIAAFLLFGLIAYFLYLHYFVVSTDGGVIIRNNIETGTGTNVHKNATVSSKPLDHPKHSQVNRDCNVWSEYDRGFMMSQTHELSVMSKTEILKVNKELRDLAKNGQDKTRC